MPGGNKYSVQTKNRFALADSSADSDSGSEDVATGNFDPYQMIQTATAEAVKKTKEELKNAKKNALIVKKTEPAEEKKDDEKPKGNRNRNNNNRREPRGNQQQRRGPRNERRPKDGEAGGEGDVAKNNNNQPLGENNQPRQRRERRQNDRKSGDPKTGRKAEEKRGGAGKGNWGKADKNYDEEEKSADAGAEEKPIEKPADGEAAPEEQENQEPEEPAGPAPISLEEYMASLGVSEAPKNLRKANDGQDIISKNAFRSNKIHKENLTSFKPVERTNNKEYISPENLSFVSRADRGGFFYTDNRRDNNRGDRRNNRGGNKGGQPKEFNLKAMNDEAFPSLGGKVAAK